MEAWTNSEAVLLSENTDKDMHIENQENTREKVPHAGPGQEPGPDWLVEACEHGVRARRLRDPVVHPRWRRRRGLGRRLGRGWRGRELQRLREVAREQNPGVMQVGGEGGCRRWAAAEGDEVTAVGERARIGEGGGRWALGRRRGEEIRERRCGERGAAGAATELGCGGAEQSHIVRGVGGRLP